MGKERFIDAKVLNYINNLICKNDLRRDYSIIIIYDGVSNYFCNRGYQLISEFERKLRQLIYIILIKIFGLEWYNKTVRTDLKAKIKEITKGKNESVLIENALQEMTFKDLESYLFDSYKEVSIDEIIKSKEDINKLLSEENKENLYLLFEKCLPKSLWSRFFENDIGNIKTELNEIRVFRNIISHNKQFYLEDYNKFCKVMQSVKSKVENAINHVNQKLIDTQFVVDSSIAYNNMYNIRKKSLASSGVTQMLDQLSKIQESFRNPFMDQVLEQEARIQRIMENSGTMRIAEQSSKIQESFRNSFMDQVLEQEARIQRVMESSGIMQIAEQSSKIQESFRNPFMDQILEREARIQRVMENPGIIQMAEQSRKMQEIIENSPLKKVLDQETRVKKVLNKPRIVTKQEDNDNKK